LVKKRQTAATGFVYYAKNCTKTKSYKEEKAYVDNNIISH